MNCVADSTFGDFAIWYLDWEVRMGVPFLAGSGWGWQVQRDRMAVWAMVQHSFIWVIGLQFAVAG
jgi:hypothetical protein